MPHSQLVLVCTAGLNLIYHNMFYYSMMAMVLYKRFLFWFAGAKSLKSLRGLQITSGILKSIGILWLLPVLITTPLKAQNKDSLHPERLRPQLHFTPKAHWINDPNGLIYIKGTYHMFYQYYPKAINWGPMHWGHAISRDLIHWQQLPIALYPDSLGYIFSGSAVYDKDNTSGWGSKAHPAMVAIFTHHDPKKADSGKIDVERQSIAYSLDEGHSWTKYAGNPVVQNPGVRDFRDPKVFWYAPDSKWVMVVAASDRVRLYDSKNLKQWREISQFGQHQGSHGSVWECPDLFTLRSGNTTKWVLTVCEGNGGPNKGSGVQYFIGDFDGQQFTSGQQVTRWLEYGPDDYAGNTWNGLANKRLYIGWMTNLMYAGNIPATTWRGEMTLPRSLGLQKINGKYYLSQTPVKALDKQRQRMLGQIELTDQQTGPVSIQDQPDGKPLLIELQQQNNSTAGFKLELTSAKGDTLEVGLDMGLEVGLDMGLDMGLDRGLDKGRHRDKYKDNQKDNDIDNGRYYITRAGAGDMAFARDMAPVLYAPRIKDNTRPAFSKLQLILDRNSIELFADNGLTVMTALVFPNACFEKITLSKMAGHDQHVHHDTHNPNGNTLNTSKPIKLRKTTATSSPVTVVRVYQLKGMGH